MAPSTTVANMRRDERDVLDHFKEGVGLRTIGLRTDLEVADVQTIVNELAGGDRTKAASLVAAYDKAHAGEATAPRPKLPAPASATAEPSVRRPGRTPTARKPARQPAQPAEDAPAAPTVVPVDLTENALADLPVTAVADPIPADLEDPPAAATEDPAPADPLGAPAGAAEAARVAAEALPTVGHWAGARVPDLPIEACTHGGDCPVHPNARSIHNFDDDPRAADLAFPPLAAAPALVDPLAGPTEALPDVGSFEELMAAVAGVPELAELAGRVSTLVDVLHDRYDREGQSRKVRAEALILRRELDTRLALLAKLADGDGPAARALVSPEATAAA